MVAEAILDAAPGAELLVARATAREELYDGAQWLTGQGVDVIVHAAGWHYDGPGDGTSPFYLDENGDPDRYSPLNVVDTAVSNGITWVNAAGNQARHTWFWTSSDYTTVQETGQWKNHVVFRPDEATPRSQTCLPFNADALQILLFHMRWADDWPDSDGNNGAEFDLDLKAWYSRYDSPSADAWTADEEYGDSYPLESHKDLKLLAVDSGCLRVEVNNSPSSLPDWLQIQMFVVRSAFEEGLHDLPQSHSIVNPSESNNPGLIAVGAADLRVESEAIPPVLQYSSRGPVLDVGNADSFNRTKPDLVVGSHGITWHRRNEEVTDEKDGRLFGGTSQATGHLGGLAALVIQKMRSEADFRPCGHAVVNGAAILGHWGGGIVYHLPDDLGP